MGFYWVSLGQNGFQWVLLGFFWFFFVGVLLDVSGRCDGIIKEAALAFALANTGRIEASSPPFNEPVGFFSFSFYFFFCFFFLFFLWPEFPLGKAPHCSVFDHLTTASTASARIDLIGRHFHSKFFFVFLPTFT